MKKTLRKIAKKHSYPFAEWDSGLEEDFFNCKCGETIGEFEAFNRYGYTDIESWHSNHVAKKLNKAVTKELRRAWNGGLSAGRVRWMDNREFGDEPVNPYNKNEQA